MNAPTGLSDDASPERERAGLPGRDWGSKRLARACPEGSLRALCWEGLGHLKTSEVGAVLKSTVKRIERFLRLRGFLQTDEEEADPDVPADPESNLAASPVSGPGRHPTGRSQWARKGQVKVLDITFGL